MKIPSRDGGDLDLVTDVTFGPRHTNYESVSHLGETSFFLSDFSGGMQFGAGETFCFFKVRWRLF